MSLYLELKRKVRWVCRLGLYSPGLSPLTSAFSHAVPFSFQTSHEAGHGCAAPAGQAPQSVFPPLGGRGESAPCQAVEHMKHTPHFCVSSSGGDLSTSMCRACAGLWGVLCAGPAHPQLLSLWFSATFLVLLLGALVLSELRLLSPHELCCSFI